MTKLPKTRRRMKTKKWLEYECGSAWIVFGVHEGRVWIDARGTLTLDARQIHTLAEWLTARDGIGNKE